MSGAIFASLLAGLQSHRTHLQRIKIWVRRHFDEIWPHFEGIFDDFLHYAVERSRCDRFPRQHFKHSGYSFEADIRALEPELKVGNQEFDSI